LAAGGSTNGLRGHLVEREREVGRQWPIWVLALFIYMLAGLVLLTRVRIPSTLHLTVFVMAAGVLMITAFRIEWGVLVLALILPFARPGISLGTLKTFHVSGFNVALVGVVMAYVLRYLADKGFAAQGPLLRKTRLDGLVLSFLVLFYLSSLVSFNYEKTTLLAATTTAVYMKETILYFMWFYLVVTILRKPDDVRRFLVAFAVAGFISSLIGMLNRVTGGAQAVTSGTLSEDLGEGAGGRMGGAGGGWLGLGHPNMFAAILLMTVPIWFFAVSHIKRGFRRLVAEFAVLNGFLGLLLTYSRSAWLGSALGIGLIGLADRKTLKWLVIFVFLFAVSAQTIILFTTGLNLTDVVVNRIMQLEESRFSGRPDIYKQTMSVIRDHPLLGVGPGGFQEHAPPSKKGVVYHHTHNVFLQHAVNTGIPSAVIFASFWIYIIVLSVRNVRRIGQVPGYGFMALGTAAALFGLTAQALVVQIFHQRILGFAYYSLAAMVVALDRMIEDGEFDELQPTALIGSASDADPSSS
jgi:hypothetical protein